MQDEDKLVVKKSNSLVDAYFCLPLIESRVLSLAIAQIPPKASITTETMIFVDAHTYGEMFGVHSKTVYRQLEKAINGLAERWVTIPDTDGAPKDIRWITTKKYLHRQGRIGINFHPDMIPYISDLRSHFTQYNLNHIAHMGNKYSLPLYELLIKRRDLNQQYFEIDYLRKKLQLGDKYKPFKEFRRNVLEPVMNDLNAENSEFIVSYEPIKKGRSVLGVQVMYKPRNPKRSLPRSRNGTRPEGRSQKPKAIYEQHGYRSAGEWREALELREKIEFDINDPKAFLQARNALIEQTKRDDSSSEGGENNQEELF